MTNHPVDSSQLIVDSRGQTAAPVPLLWCVRQRPLGFCVERRRLTDGSLQRLGAFRTKKKADAVMAFANRAEEAGARRNAAELMKEAA
ncbi:hypothetical protein CfE428DRAFT_5822 [Chthoniobacter flavus Ellin428]|uniref:Uncharacterized protein n=1 Tax=Chthoniobacter flavus Ellin428 TaxID=497964 RepID=B4DA82_9BACT|nr:hypothetical protein [Chthoniobacter flavus]EDY16709.1 hypothetical protein CfE428DRAFT_5822 [Chthoniobacter flavus Ellin428]TCO87275.1 hypothetical protein EV701_123112 [Chthoniobacter flavus]